MFKPIIAGVITLFTAITLWGCAYTIDQSERGVLTRTGAIVGTVQPGFNLKLPFINQITKISIANQVLRWKDLEGYSHDQQQSHYQISVNYQLKPDRVEEVYANWGGEDGIVSRIITPNVLKQSKIVIGHYTAQTSIQDRAKLNNDILSALVDATEGTPITVTNANVEDIRFGTTYLDSINQRMIAEVGVQTLKQNLERERVNAQITVTKAQATADSTLATAKADADATKLRGAADAFAIDVKAKALAANSNLVSLVTAEKWDGKLPTTMLPGTSTPMVSIK